MDSGGDGSDAAPSPTGGHCGSRRPLPPTTTSASDSEIGGLGRCHNLAVWQEGVQMPLPGPPVQGSRDPARTPSTSTERAGMSKEM